MLLTIDLGNTNIVLGIFRDRELLYHWRISTHKWETSDEFGISFRNLLGTEGIPLDRIDGIIIASVVPQLQEALIEMARAHFKINPYVVTSELISKKAGMPILYPNPHEIGADRLVNAVAGYKKYGGPLIIVDFGTATTFCTITERGEYLGGCIAPGINISADALYRYTAKLPRVEIIKPAQVIGKTTIGSIQSGIFYGHAALVDGIVERIQKEAGISAQVIATGGLSGVIGPETKSIRKIDPWLTLDGLLLIYERLQ